MSEAPDNRIPAEWVDEIPTNPSPYKAQVVSVAVIMLGSLALAAWRKLKPAFEAFLERNVEIAILFEETHLEWPISQCFSGFGVLGMICSLAGALGFLRSKATYQVLRAALVAVYLVAGAYLYFSWQGSSVILGSDLEVDGSKQDRATILVLWWKAAWPALAVIAYAVWLQVMLQSRSVYAAFSGATGDAMKGDRVLEDVRTHGRDPRHRKSLYASVLTHIFILIGIPWILSLGGCVEAYKVPQGSGEPVVAVVKVVKPKKKKKKTLTLRPNSAIIFDQPDLDNTEVDQVMEQKTQVTYQASANAKAGKMG